MNFDLDSDRDGFTAVSNKSEDRLYALTGFTYMKTGSFSDDFERVRIKNLGNF